MNSPITCEKENVTWVKKITDRWWGLDEKGYNSYIRENNKRVKGKELWKGYNSFVYYYKDITMNAA